MADVFVEQAQRRRQSHNHNTSGKYAENSGIALVMKSARTSHAGSVSSLLGDLQYAFVGVSGAPRPMKMGTSASPWRYDAAG
jgi:hypothetical protein